MAHEVKHYHIDDAEIRSGVIQKVIEPLWFCVNIYEDEQRYNKDLEQFSQPQRYIFAIQWYFAEVYNGGHDQFFFNSTGIVWRDALEGFRAIGLDSCAEILAEAASRMGGSPSMDREERWEQQERFNAEFDDLDSRFYALDEEELHRQMTEYMLNNAESFYFDGDIPPMFSE